MPIGHLLLALAAVMVTGRVLGALFRRIGQPPVIGEVVGGILLGPSLLGWVSPEAYAFILPADVRPVLGAVAQLGVVLYMFLVGVELNPETLRGQWRATVATSLSGIVVPFAMGVALAIYLPARYGVSGAPFTSFALFVGVAMAVTAFPVLARILSDLGMTRTPIGAAALASAAVSDVTAWCLLAFVVGIVQAKPEGAVYVTLLTAAFVVAMLVLVRPLVAKLARRAEGRDLEAGTVALVLILLLLAALATEAIGVHAIFGAFLFGVTIPHDSRLAEALHRSFEHLVTILFLPAFFAFTGMRTEIGLLAGWNDWAVFGLVVLIASVGKAGGTFVGARLTGFGSRQAAALGILMNTRGLMELIVLNVGLEMGVISPLLFTTLVLMAIATTIATAPLLRRITPQTSQLTTHN